MSEQVLILRRLVNGFDHHRKADNQEGCKKSPCSFLSTLIKQGYDAGI
jgi:hypothetical protein